VINRKLGRTSAQRKALLRGLVTDLLWYGKITTTEAKAKEVRSIAEQLLTLAIKTYDKTETVTKEVVKKTDGKAERVTMEFVNDLPEKLNARRKIMAVVYDKKEEKKDGESKSEYADRTRDINHPLVEKMFREYGPKYRARNEEKNCAGGYTRIIKMGPRKGDGAEEVIIELI